MPDVYNDQQVVAALNSCLDLEKFNKLPSLVRNRLEVLCRRHRLGMVCFMGSEGFGLKVYGSECRPVPQVPVRIDEDGHWMRCPASVWNPEEVKEWQVMDERGMDFFEKWQLAPFEDSDEDEDEEDDRELTNKNRVPRWISSHNRVSRAMKFTRKEAEEVAKEVKGVVVKV